MARLVFMGTPAFAVPALEALLAAGHDVLAVVTQPDRPSGRGQQLQPCPVKVRALEAGLEVLQPDRLRRDEVVKAHLQALGADAFIVVAFGQLLPADVLAMPAHGCLNIHGSLLPRHRGAAPVARAIMAGDAESGISLMRLDEGMDTGPVIAEARTAIGVRETAGQLAERLALLGADLLVRELGPWLAGERPEQPQDQARATLAPKLDKAEAEIDWSLAAPVLDARIRGLLPWPGARTRFAGLEIKVHAAQPELLPAEDASPGTVVRVDAEGWWVACGTGMLLLSRVQIPGRKAMPAVEAARGLPALVAGARLG
ncbi:MAG: methionyl-tRNA formyltransferase [Candidatus Sericytochromatia bacterium]|nr:methionyl-tRNA formyltransferase [Candidatus Tanganyikabacteria bacterium]